MPTKQIEEVIDPLEKMLKETGCIDLHYKLQDCMAEKQDWRKCQKEVEIFKTCMADYDKKRRRRQHM